MRGITRNSSTSLTVLQYRIDCISDPRKPYDGDSPYECQGILSSPRPLSRHDLPIFAAIWIFGIFALAELHRTRFWGTLSRQFQQRGPDYVERCTIQNETQCNADDDAISPALFPPLPELDPDTEEVPPFVSEEDIKEVSDTPRISNKMTQYLCNRSTQCWCTLCLDVIFCPTAYAPCN